MILERSLEERVYDVLTKELFTEDQFCDVASSSHGEEKLACLANNPSLLEFLLREGFNGYHVALIFVGNDWKSKLDWITGEYESVLKPMGFNSSHVAQIVINADWRDKLDWLADNYRSVLMPRRFSPSHAAKIMRGKSWHDKMKWIRTEYDASPFTPSDVQEIMVTRDWRDWLYPISGLVPAYS